MSQDIVHVIPNHKVQPKKLCCVLLNELSKGIIVINQEFQRLQMLENEYNKKLQIYLELSRNVDKKLCNLWDMSSQILHSDYNRAMEMYAFTNRVIKIWQDRNAEIAKDIQNVLLVSFTNPNAPLKVVVEKILTNSYISKDTYKKMDAHIFCMGRFNSIYTQALPLFGRLRNGNLILQYFLSVTRSIPHLINLENYVDQYVSSLSSSLLPQMCQIATGTATITSSVSQNPVPQARTEGEELSAYIHIVQLLNGELVAEENPLHHHSNIVPLVSNEYILPDILPETVEMREDVRNNTSQFQNEVTKDPLSIIRNEFLPNEIAPALMYTPQKHGIIQSEFIPNEITPALLNTPQKYGIIRNEFLPNENTPALLNASQRHGIIQNEFLPNEITSALLNTPQKLGTIRNEFLPYEIAPTLLNAPQEAAPTVSRKEGRRVEIVLVERPANNNLKFSDTSMISSSLTKLIKPILQVPANDRKILNRRRQTKAETDSSDLKPIKIPKLKTDLLAPLT